MSKQKIISHPSLIHNEDLKTICQPLQKLGIHYFAHVNINDASQFSVLSLDPVFIKLYLEKSYYNFDAHFVESRISEQYLIWDTIEREKESKILYDDFHHCSLGHTFTIMQNNGDSKDCYHFGSWLGNNAINGAYLQNIDLLKKFILYFQDKVNSSKELRAAYDIRFSMTNHEAGYHAKNLGQVITAEELMPPLDLKRFYLNRSTWLSRKEIECLHWLSYGKTADEVAMIMSITQRTVRAHIRNIKDKLNCQSQFQLGIAYAKLQNLIEIE